MSYEIEREAKGAGGERGATRSPTPLLLAILMARRRHHHPFHRPSAVTWCRFMNKTTFTHDSQFHSNQNIFLKYIVSSFILNFCYPFTFSSSSSSLFLSPFFFPFHSLFSLPCSSPFKFHFPFHFSTISLSPFLTLLLLSLHFLTSLSTSSTLLSPSFACPFHSPLQLLRPFTSRDR